MTSLPNRPDLRRIGESALTQVLSTLSPRSSTAGNPSTPLIASDAHEQITSSIALKGPRLCGSVLVRLPRGFVTHATHVLTGLDGNAAEANGLLDDTAGELANMMAGCVATHLAQDGYACTLGTPSVSRNSHRAIELPPGDESGGTELTWGGYRLAIEIQCHYVLS